jgi:hypothetical protein
MSSRSVDASTSVVARFRRSTRSTLRDDLLDVTQAGAEGQATLAQLFAEVWRVVGCAVEVGAQAAELGPEVVVMAGELRADRTGQLRVAGERERLRCDDGNRARGAPAWREALGPLRPRERQVVVDTMRAYERGVSGE